MISPFGEDFIFTKFHENKTLAKTSGFTVYIGESFNQKHLNSKFVTLIY